MNSYNINYEPLDKSKFDNKQTNLVILGASGFIGRNITESLRKTSYLEILCPSSTDVDLTDYEKTISLTKCMMPDSAVVVAAGVTPDKEEPLRGMLDNIKIAANLGALIALSNISHLVYLSTVDVYGRENLILPLDETSKIQPSSYYAISKYSSEMIFGKACIDKGVPFTILRMPGVYGPGDTHESPVNVFITSAIKGIPVRIAGDGSQLRDFLFVEDIHRVVRYIVIKRITGTFNVVTGKSHTIEQVLDMIENISGRCLNRIYEKEKSDKLNLVYKKSALLRYYPGFRFTTLSAGLGKTYQYNEGCCDA